MRAPKPTSEMVLKKRAANKQNRATKKTERKKLNKLVIANLIIWPLLLILVIILPTDDSGSNSTKRQKIVDYEPLISSFTLNPYTIEAGFPNLVEEYDSRMEEIYNYRRKAAEIALNGGHCDYVNYSEISDSSTIDSLVFWVDCDNGARIYLTEFEIDDKLNQ